MAVIKVGAATEAEMKEKKFRVEDALTATHAAVDKYVDLLEAVIIDPKKVTRCALQNAASVAGLLLTTECMITDIPEKKEPAPAANPGMGGMGGMM